MTQVGGVERERVGVRQSHPEGWWPASDGLWYPPDVAPGEHYDALAALRVDLVPGAPRRGVPASGHLRRAVEDERRRATTTITAGAVAIVAGAGALSAAGDTGQNMLLGRLGLLPMVAGGVFAAVAGVRYLRSQGAD